MIIATDSCHTCAEIIYEGSKMNWGDIRQGKSNYQVRVGALMWTLTNQFFSDPYQYEWYSGNTVNLLSKIDEQSKPSSLSKKGFFYFVLDNNVASCDSSGWSAGAKCRQRIQLLKQDVQHLNRADAKQCPPSMDKYSNALKTMYTDTTSSVPTGLQRYTLKRIQEDYSGGSSSYTIRCCYMPNGALQPKAEACDGLNMYQYYRSGIHPQLTETDDQYWKYCCATSYINAGSSTSTLCKGYELLRPVCNSDDFGTTTTGKKLFYINRGMN